MPSGECCGDARTSIHTYEPFPHPDLPYRLHDTCNNARLVIGKLSDTLADLLLDLKRRYGECLGLASIREAFEKRATIMKFDISMSRGDAGQAPADELRSLKP